MTGDWRQQRERSTAFALRSIRWIAMKLGRPPARALLYPITGYYLLFAPTSRRHSRDFLKRVTGHPASLAAVARHFFTFAAVILDRVFLLAGREQVLDVSVHGAELLDEFRDSGRGALLLGGHFGSFEVLRALAVARTNYDIRALMYANHNARLTRLLDEINPDVANTVIDLDDPAALLRVNEATAAGAFVGILADRVSAADASIECAFLDEAARFPTGPMRLAAVLGTPVVLFFGSYEGGNRYRIRFEALTEPGRVSARQRTDWVARMTRAYVYRLEAVVRRSPENWFNFYDFWQAGRN